MLAAPERSTPPSPASPGLTTLVVYMRPTPRPSLVGPLAELGLFVHEITGEQLEGLFACDGVPPDFVTVIGRNCDQHLRAVHDLARSLTPAILAIWPDGEDFDLVQTAGATAILADSECPTRLAARVGAVARIARGLREARDRHQSEAAASRLD